MKIAMYTDPKAYAEACERNATAIEQNGLRLALEQLENAKKGIGRDWFLKTNNISDAMADEMWAKHNEWLQKSVDSIKRQVKKYRREAKRALALV